jgi:hypothetical protein
MTTLLPQASGADNLYWWPRSDFTREELELSTKLNTLALLLVPLLPLPPTVGRKRVFTKRFWSL